MRRVKITREAVEELSEAYAWYLIHADEETAERLLQEAAAAVERLKDFAHSYQPMERTQTGVDVRRMPLSRFRYMYVYVIDREDIVQVVALTHVRRERYWRARLS